MRENKFRGKRVDNGEWVYGYYVKEYYSPKLFVSHLEIEHYIHIGAFDAVRNAVKHEVHPDSVGQSTGLKDKNGVDLDWWEGDLLELDGGDSGTHEVVWDDNGACFMCGEELLVNVRDGYKVVKVGSIHTHPDLLKNFP